MVERPVVAARLDATVLGINEAFLNGRRVEDAELAPGLTHDSRLQVQTYDVTDLLRPGGNVLRMIIADGWFPTRRPTMSGRWRSPIQVDVSVPPGSVAALVLPDGPLRELPPGRRRIDPQDANAYV